MKISKIINNNLVHFYDENNVDCIAMGRGLGFGKKIGDEFGAMMVEKVYGIEDPIRTKQFSTLVKDIPLAHLEVANMIIDYAKSSLNTKLSDNIYISLVDHIDFALERIEQGIPFENKLLYEIKHYYTSEYLVGLEALNIVERELKIKLPEDEAGYIAIHLVEALGATHERSVFCSILPAAKSGILAGIILGVGRAIGETMAVIMVAGNQARMPQGILQGVRTLTANIVIEMGYAEGLHREALIATGVVLFAFILIINLSFSVVKMCGERK